MCRFWSLNCYGMHWCVHWFEITGLDHERFPWSEFFFFFILVEIFSASTVRCHHDDLVEIDEICVEIDAIGNFLLKYAQIRIWRSVMMSFGMCDEVLGVECEVGNFGG